MKRAIERLSLLSSEKFPAALATPLCFVIVVVILFMCFIAFQLLYNDFYFKKWVGPKTPK